MQERRNAGKTEKSLCRLISTSRLVIVKVRDRVCIVEAGVVLRLGIARGDKGRQLDVEAVVGRTEWKKRKWKK